MTNIGGGSGFGLIEEADTSGLIPTSRQVIAGDGLTGGGALSSDVTLNVAAADASIAVTSNAIAVGVISAAQHGVQTDGGLHAVATTVVAGFESAADKTNLNSLTANAVIGPASATDNAIARYDGTTGKLIQNSGVTLSDAGTLTATAFIGDGSGITGIASGTPYTVADGETMLVADGKQIVLGMSIENSGWIYNSGWIVEGA